MERKRVQISFRLEDAQHAEALAYLEKHANRSDYVIQCILQAEEQDRLLLAVRETIQDCLSGVQLSGIQPPPAPDLPFSGGMLESPMPESGEISTALLQFLDEF